MSAPVTNQLNCVEERFPGRSSFPVANPERLRFEQLKRRIEGTYRAVKDTGPAVKSGLPDV
jgi:hypothetical protein